MSTKEVSSFFSRNRFAISITTLMGTIIGAGILGIPYVIAKAGYLYGFFLIVLMGVAYVYLNLFFGEVVLRTKKQHQFPGYAEKYLGKTGKRITAVAMVLGVYGALTAYLIGVGEASFAIFRWGTPLVYTILFFVICTIIVLGGIKAMGKAELILIPLLVIVVLTIGIVSFNQLDYSSLVPWDWQYFFLPYGVLIFAYMGFASIPVMREVLEKDTKKMKQAIIIGSLIPLFLYALFALIIIGVVGLDSFELLKPNERIATIALSMYSNPFLGALANILAILAMSTSFLTMAIALKEVFHYDFKLSPITSFFLTLLIPLLIAVFGIASFLTILGITGAVSGGLQGILLIFMYWKAQLRGDRKPEYSLGRQRILGILFVLMFSLGIGYTVWTLL